MQLKTNTVTFSTEARQVVVSAGETASWQFVLDVPAATVEAITVEIGGTPTDLEGAYWVLAGVPATIVGGFLPGGVDQYIGKPHTWSIQAYGFQVRQAIADGSSTWKVS